MRQYHIWPSRAQRKRPPVMSHSKQHYIRISKATSDVPAKRLRFTQVPPDEFPILREWARRFRDDPAPSHALTSSDVRVVHHAVRGQLITINIVAAWQLFHRTRGLTQVYDIYPRVASVSVPYVRLNVTCAPEQVIFTGADGLQHVIKCYPTRSFESVIRTEDLPVGIYTLGEITFERVTRSPTISSDNDTKFDVDVLELAHLFNPVSIGRVLSAWDQCTRVFLHRRKRIATPQEIASFTALHDKGGLVFCIDPLRSGFDRLVYKNPQFIQTFGDCEWQPVEHQNYEQAILCLLQRNQPIGRFNVKKVNGELINYTWQAKHAPKNASHALIMGTWVANQTSNMLTEYVEHACAMDTAFSPASSTSTWLFFNAQRSLYLMRGYRPATAEEIQEASARVTGIVGTVLDLVRPYDQAYVYANEEMVRMFGYWPPTDMSVRDSKRFMTDISQPFSYRVQALSGEVFTFCTQFSFLNNETRLLMSNGRCFHETSDVYITRITST